MAGRDRVKGQGNAALGKGSSRTVRSNLERGYRVKSPPVERRKACVPQGTRAPLEKVPNEGVALTGAPLPSRM